MPVIDHKWLETDAGSQILHAVKSDKRLKSFGILEKPTLAAPYTLYDEASFKVVVLGNSFCGKTSFLEALCQRKTASNEYNMTPGEEVSVQTWSPRFQSFEMLLRFKRNTNQPSLLALQDC